MRWLCVLLVGCVMSREAIVRELATCSGAVRVTSTGLDDDTGMEILRADGCGTTVFYRCRSRPRTAHSCCESIGDPIRRISAAATRCD